MIAIQIQTNPINEAYVRRGKMETARILEDGTICRGVTRRSDETMNRGNTHHSRGRRRQLADHFRRGLG